MKLIGKIVIGMTALCLFHGTALAKTWTVGFVTGAEEGIQSGFIRMASQGLFKAKQEHGFKVVTETPENVSQEAMAVAFRRMMDRKPDLVMGTGFQMSEHLRLAASQHPDVLFLMNDVPVEDMPNVMSIQFAAQEGSFLVGILAGLMTKTGTVGAICGVDIPPVIAFLTGFKEGVHYAAPSVRIQETFISRRPDFSGFSSPDKAAALAKEWYGQDVDIIFALGGTSGNGIIRQAQVNKKYAIGVDVDQDDMAVGHVLTSMLKRLDVAVYLAISQIVKGGFRPGVTYYGLKEGGVGLTEMRYTKDLIPAAVLEALREAERKIVSGELTVPAAPVEKQ